MKPSQVMRLVSLLTVSCFLGAPSVMAAESKTVIVIFSNDRLLPANIDVDRGLREALAGSLGAGTEVFAEFLDRPVFTGEAYEQAVATYLSDKYRARPPAVIVAVGAFALAFTLRHRVGQLFPDVPVVHVGTEGTYLEPLSLPADVVGIPVDYDYAGSIVLAARLHPDTRRVVVVTGAGEWDRESESALRMALAGFEDRFVVEFLAGLPSDVVMKRLSELGQGDVVFTPGYFVDGAGRVFAPRDSAALMAAAATAPIYAPYNTFIGTGVVGGRMPTYVEMGRQAATIVTALLDGVPPAALQLPASVPPETQIDWRQVRKWQIDASDIPSDAVLFFKEPSLWEAYRSQAIIILVVIVLQAALIGALLLERRLRRRTAFALAESEQRMSLAARAAGLSTWVWDERVLDTVHPGDRDSVQRATRRAVEQGEELDVEYRRLDADGNVRWIAARGRAQKDVDERLVGVALDVTPRKVAELQAAQDRAALTHMTRVSMMGQLSASIAHQLNQPLAAILGNAEAARTMLQRNNVDVAELREICDDIVSQDNRAAEVIRRLGALYKRGEAKLVPLDLNDLVSETLDLLRTELVTRHVAAVTELATELPAIDGDRVQLQQVLLNLTLNAADAMSEIDATERRLVVRTELDGANVRLCVVDRGTGIAAKDIDNVFDAFWSTKTSGFGVGLAICKAIVTAHRGSLAVTNNSDRGTTFSVTWPMRAGPLN